MGQRSGTPRQLWQARGVDATPFAVLSALDWRLYTLYPPVGQFKVHRILLQYLGDGREASEWNIVFSLIYTAGGWTDEDARDPQQPRPFVPIEPRSPRPMPANEIKRIMSAHPFVYREEMPPE